MRVFRPTSVLEDTWRARCDSDAIRSDISAGVKVIGSSLRERSLIARLASRDRVERSEACVIVSMMPTRRRVERRRRAGIARESLNFKRAWKHR